MTQNDDLFISKGFIKESTDPYKFDIDLIGALALTKNNVERIEFLIGNDSDYRDETSDEKQSGDIESEETQSDEDPKTVAKFLSKNPHVWDMKNDESKVELIEKLVAIIDKANSTHQSSEGPKGEEQQKKEGNFGRERTARYIAKIDDFKNRINDCDPELVDEIAKNAISDDQLYGMSAKYVLGGRYTFSFASKFCTYVSREISPEADAYSIYDKVVRTILPYYAFVYLGDSEITKLDWNKDLKPSKDPYYLFGSKDKFGKNVKGKWDYEEYANLIGKIIEANERLTGKNISRKDFDHLLWYYYKGNVPKLREAREAIADAEKRKEAYKEFDKACKSKESILNDSEWRLINPISSWS